MKLRLIFLFTVLFGGSFYFFKNHTQPVESPIWSGAFLADNPSARDIESFQSDFGSKPYLINIFLDWEKFPEPELIGSVYGRRSVLMVTWEPWAAESQAGVSFEDILSGKHDAYILKFAEKLKKVGQPVFLRFAHEMNGDWYPWAGLKVGREKYIQVWHHIKEIFDAKGATNVLWVFSVNAEDVPRENNSFMDYYPGDAFVDYVGIDGYNWGTSRPGTHWQSFEAIFREPYEVATERLRKPVLITEFSSSSRGGDKAVWIRDAFNVMLSMANLKGWVLFNQDKETDWSFSPHSLSGKALRLALTDSRAQPAENL